MNKQRVFSVVVDNFGLVSNGSENDGSLTTVAAFF